MFPLQNRSNHNTDSHECIYQRNLMDKIMFPDLVLPLYISLFDLSDYVLIFLIFQALNTAKCAAASVGCIYILKRNWLCILGHSFVSSCIRVYVYLFIFFALCLINSHILSPNAISKYLLQLLLLFAFLVFDLRITFATNSQFLLTIIN